MNRNIPDRYLASIKPPKAGRTVITDNLVRGLTFRVTSKGTRSWSFRYRRPVDGKQIQTSTGPRAIELTAAIAKGGDPVAEEKSQEESRNGC